MEKFGLLSKKEISLEQLTLVEIPVDVSQVKTIDSAEIKYTELASPLIALGIIATSLFYVKSIYDKRRLNSLINS